VDCASQDDGTNENSDNGAGPPGEGGREGHTALKACQWVCASPKKLAVGAVAVAAAVAVAVAVVPHG
jgi:hypothetical protein